VDDGQPLGFGRDVAVLAGEMVRHGRHVARAEYHADLNRLGGVITVNLVEHDQQPGIPYGGEVVFHQPVKPAAGQVLRALVIHFRLVLARQRLGVEGEHPHQPDRGRSGDIDRVELEPLGG
jgi:hypothetical protein